jgi:hypothetical protein
MGEPVDPSPPQGQASAAEQAALEDSLLGSFEQKARRRTRLPTLVSLTTGLFAVAASLVADLVVNSVDLPKLHGVWSWVPLGLILVVYAGSVIWSRPSRRRAKPHDIAIAAADAVWTQLSIQRRAGTQYRGGW